MRALLVYDALSGGHYRGDAGLVVRAENGGAVGGDEGLTLEGSQMRELFDRQAAPARAEDDVAAVIVLDELRLNVLAGEVGYGVKMGDEADAGLVLIALARGDEAVNIGVLVLIYALQPKRAHLVGQHVAQCELAVAARYALRGLGACGVGLDIGDKSFVGFHVLSPYVKFYIIRQTAAFVRQLCLGSILFYFPFSNFQILLCAVLKLPLYSILLSLQVSSLCRQLH